MHVKVTIGILLLPDKDFQVETRRVKLRSMDRRQNVTKSNILNKNEIYYVKTEKIKKLKKN